MQLVSSHVSNNKQDGGHTNRILRWLQVRFNRKGKNQGPLYKGDSNELREWILKVWKDAPSISSITSYCKSFTIDNIYGIYAFTLL